MVSAPPGAHVQKSRMLWVRCDRFFSVCIVMSVLACQNMHVHVRAGSMVLVCIVREDAWLVYCEAGCE